MRPSPARPLACLSVALLLAGLAGPGCRAAGDGARVLSVGQVSRTASPRILCVVAHPDDELAFAGTLYKTATHLGGACDVLVITNGEGGFKYATLAEPVYGLELTDESLGRRHLPAIRQRELVAGCRWLGVRDVLWLGEQDLRYTLDDQEVLGPGSPWDLARVRREIRRALARGGYDFVLTLAPTAETHGHHKAATILALEAVAELPLERRPVVLCAEVETADEPARAPEELPGHPLTRPRTTTPLVFDRRQRFGHRDALDYRIVVDWAIAEHKSQGTMQLLMHAGERERYVVLDVAPSDAEERAVALFTALAAPQFTPRAYGPSAGIEAVR